MNLSLWAKRWNVPEVAIHDLRGILGLNHTGVAPVGLSEAAIQNLVRLEASKKGCRLWRNNVGATYTPDGALIRYGLANESTGVNKQIKSADLIGIRPVKITQNMVGAILGQFMSREVKAANWRYANTEREQAQLRWAELILSLGGDACFVNGEGTI
jgi:hypothetical protein